MNAPVLDQAAARLAQSNELRGQPISHILTRSNQTGLSDMLRAMGRAERLNQPLSLVLISEELATPAQVLDAQAQAYGALKLALADHPVDPTVTNVLNAEFCLENGVFPWMRIGETLLLATAQPDGFDALTKRLPSGLGPVSMALATRSDIHAQIARTHGRQLALQAENWVPDDASCRDMGLGNPAIRVFACTGIAACLLMLFLNPTLFFTGALLLALTSLVLAQGLKLAAFLALPRPQAARQPELPDPPPRVSLLVPLFREAEIASSLITRLTRLTYPKSLLDVVLILEAEDDTTRAVLNRTTLPPWMRVITVPPGQITTKPRALNYAFQFARGDIIGIYDAEDAPASDQIDKVVDHFNRAPHTTGCLQGILDFYNPRANWLSRCFAVEYASWFRVLLPGLARLGLAVPLGGTTVFFRREVLEQVAGWDAHNVTEDADLGIRLARHGFRTELIQTVTREEANNRFWPWIKQRSRWLKGYAITWWVHSRDPKKLLQDLGPKKFLGVQLLFLTTLAQFLLAPVLWSFWLILFGLPHPLNGIIDQTQARVLTGLFLSAEAITVLIGFIALSRSPHARLIPWVPTLFAYFPLGSLAAYKALGEIARKPFYWDKTEHGQSHPDSPAADQSHF